MSTSPIINASPRARLLGFKDESGRVVAPESESVPLHLAHVFFFAERAIEEPLLLPGSQLTSIYGDKTFELRGPFVTHAVPLIKALVEPGTYVMAQALVPEDAGPASTLCLYLDLLPTQVEQYERNTDGTYKTDSAGKKIPTGTKVAGYVGKWIVAPIGYGLTGEAKPTGLGQGLPRVGTMVSTDATPVQSTLYPIHELQVPWRGGSGNNQGLRAYAASSRSSVPVNEEVVADQNTVLYRFQFVRRNDATSSANVVKTIDDAEYVEFSYKKGAIDTSVDKDLFVGNILLPSYNDDGKASGTSPVFGPFGKQHVYYGNIETVLKMIYATEKDFTVLPDTDDGYHAVNFFSASDIDGVPYHTFQLLSTLDGGVNLNETATFFAEGGSNGTMNFETFDKLVANQLSNYGDLEWNFYNSAYYPQTHLYDSGFTLETKKLFFKVLGRRKDIAVTLSTQDVSRPLNTAAEESSVAAALRSAALLYPESELYGTGVCRATIVGQAGTWAAGGYDNIVPLSVDMAYKRSAHQGAANGVYNKDALYTAYPQNLVTKVIDVNLPFKNEKVRNKDWTNGLVWAQTFDRRSLQFPGIQTVYEDDTSILNSDPIMLSCVYLQRICENAWRKLTGTTDLDEAEFKDKSDKMIRADVADRFGGLIIVEPDTFFTPDDSARGYSWSTRVNVYGANMRTVGSYTIVPQRIEDLEE